MNCDSILPNRRKEYKILWYIENYSYCWHGYTEKLVSPAFTPDGLEGTTWSIWLYPRGKTGKKDNVSFYLTRSEHDTGPERFLIEHEHSFITTNGSTLPRAKGEYAFERGSSCGFSVSLEDVLTCRKDEYIPGDTLSLCCKLWRGDGISLTVAEYSIQTRIGMENIYFLHEVENFSALQPNEKKTVQKSSKTGCNISSSLYITDNSWDGEIIVETVPSDKNHILSKQIVSLLDDVGNVIKCGVVDTHFDFRRGDTQKLLLSLRRQHILNKKSEFLPNDKLHLLCQCTFSAGVELEKIERIFPKEENPGEEIEQNFGNNAMQIPIPCPGALDDLKAIYNNQRLTDIQLKTKTKSFPAHKLILCARSSIFDSMLTSDMRERNTDCIRIEDLEDEIVQQLLLFLYSDELPNLQWESAVKLYYAADKYAIEKLKVLCSSFLESNLTTSTASELLLLADTHNDSALKAYVEDFILLYEEEVFVSDEWEKLTETNPMLVLKTMQLKYNRRKKKIIKT